MKNAKLLSTLLILSIVFIQQLYGNNLSIDSTSKSDSTIIKSFLEKLEKANTVKSLESLIELYKNDPIINNENQLEDIHPPIDKVIIKLENLLLESAKKNKGKGQFIIKDKYKYINESSPCSITYQEATGGNVLVKIEFEGDGIPFTLGGGGLRNNRDGDGSIQRYFGEIGGYEPKQIIKGEGDRLHRLTFGLIKEVGFVYLRGIGSVTSPNKKIVKLGK